MSTDLEQRIQAIEDRDAIRELCATYCFCVDTGRFDELADNGFTDDAHCDFGLLDGGMPNMISDGREQVRGFFKDVVPAMLCDMSHTVHNQRIRLEGEEASGECYFELTARDSSTGEAVVGAGRYFDRFRRVDSKWMFCERKAEIWHMSPLAAGWEKQRFLASLTEES